LAIRTTSTLPILVKGDSHTIWTLVVGSRFTLWEIYSDASGFCPIHFINDLFEDKSVTLIIGKRIRSGAFIRIIFSLMFDSPKE